MYYCARLGVDDWAIRRGQRCGTILIDLESYRVVDLLPDRSSESFAAWLVSHPEIEYISRDRGDCYIEGASAGAPQATQVADRWHLIHNLQEALVRFVERFRHELKQADQQIQRTSKTTTAPDPQPSPELERAMTQTERQQQERRSQRLALYQRVIELHEQKVSQRQIARELDLHRSTVRQWLSSGQFSHRSDLGAT